MRVLKTSLMVSRLFVLAWGVLCAVDTEAYEADPGTVGATIGGRITMIGAIPKAKPLPVHRDSAVCGMTIPNEALIIDKGSRGITDVVVSVEGVTKGKPLPDTSALVLENRACR